MLSKERLKAKIIAITNSADYMKGIKYSFDKLKLITKRTTRKNIIEYVLRVESSRTKEYYFINITIDQPKEIKCSCTCPQYNLTRSCKHIAACLYYYHKIFFENNGKDKIVRSQELLTSYLTNNKKKSIKEEIFFTFDFEIYQNYYGQTILLNMKIGNNKMYSLNNKLNQFLESYQSNLCLKFGKDFTYDPEKHFFNQDILNILLFFNNNFYNLGKGSIRLREQDFKQIITSIKDQNITINENPVLKIEERSPYLITLEKKENWYQFKIHPKLRQMINITEDEEYIYSQGIIYHVGKQIRELIQKMETSDLEELIFEEKDLNNFANSIFPIVKNEITIDPSIDNLLIGITPDTKIYFDFNDIITAKITFSYKEEEIDYFTPQNSHLLRDIEYENEVLEKLLNMNFQIKNNQIYMDDIDDIGNFIEFELEKLSHEYEIFTSEKIKQTLIHKNKQVTSTFSIGKDNIMQIAFHLDHIEEQELENILVAFKKKKKYFKLKSGDILSLEDQTIKEFDELMDELNLTYDELIQNGGVLPKYYALYLDSLKNKNFSIETDHHFDQFLKDFKTYQKVKLSFKDQEQQLLRDYQIEGVKWLYTIYKCGFGGILADEMGLGKSLQTIIYFKKVLKEKKNSKFLIIAPTSLLYNWKNEFQKFAPELSVIILNNSKKHREKLLNDFSTTVYITSYGLIREDEKLYGEKYFEACVIDEAQNIKNPKAGLTKSVKKIQSTFKLALTGTPIENSLIELWSIFDFIMPGFLSSLPNFQSKYKINSLEEQKTELDNLKRIITPFILRRKKENVAKELPSKIENTIFLDLNESEQKLYASEVKRSDKIMKDLIKKVGFQKARIEILKLLTRLRQLCISPSIIYEDYEKQSSKIENLMKIIPEIILNGHKILLFTSFRSALELVKKELENQHISNYTITGSTPSKTRMELVNKFNNDDTKVFLIMLKSGGTGLNLTSADVVIHLDLWWNPQSENQATDRTHRIGQTKTVEVIKLVTKNTIEEKILELQKKKQLLSDKLIENEEVDIELLKHLTEEDIRNLLSYENKG